MALSERKKEIILDVKEDIPNTIVQNHEWPNVLPVEMNRIVISYLLNPSFILEEVEALNEEFPVTMQPFVKAADRIKPLLKHSIFKKMHDVKDIKYELQSPLSVTSHPNIVFDNCIIRINNLPIEAQMDFLIAIYNEDWDREEKINVLAQAKKEIKEIYRDISFSLGRKDYNFDDLKTHIIYIIMTKFIDCICNAYQDSERNIEGIATRHTVENIDKILCDEKDLIRRKNYSDKKLSLILLGVGLFSLFILLFSDIDDRIKSPLGIIGGLFFIIAPFFDAFAFACREDNTPFLTLARDNLVRIQREQESNTQENNAEISLNGDEQTGSKLKYP